MRCMYYLNKNENPHTTNFSDLRELCILLDNTTLPQLRKSGNTNSESEDSPFYSVISVTKHLCIYIQYLDKNADFLPLWLQ